jgi:hypothetical protein
MTTSQTEKGSSRPPATRVCCLNCLQWMEPLWSPVVATGGNRAQMKPPPKPRNQAKTVAVRCDQLPETFHGKEGVSGSSPEEGLKRLQIGCFCCLSRRGAWR